MTGEDLKNRILRSAVHEHPLLVQGLALVPATMAADTLKNAVAVCLLLFFPWLFTAVVMCLIGRKIPAPFKAAAATVISCIVTVPVVFAAGALFPYRLEQLYFYVPLAAASTVVLKYGEHAHEKSLPEAAADVLAGFASYAFLVCLLGLIRELFGNNSIWDRPVPFPLQLDSMHLPFTALVILAFLSSLFEFIRIKYPILARPKSGVDRNFDFQTKVDEPEEESEIAIGG